MAKKYKTKAITVEAIQFTGVNFEEILDFCKEKASFEHQYKLTLGGLEPYKVVKLEAPGYYFYVQPGDMIVKIFEGTFRPYKLEMFNQLFREIN
jgi:hypothetical protein